MLIPIFTDGGQASSIRSNCVQPVIGGESGGDLSRIQSNSVYTAVLEVYYV